MIDDIRELESFYNEITLDKRINNLRSVLPFSNIVPNESWYQICIWRKDNNDVYYTQGYIQIDKTHFVNAGAEHIIEKFEKYVNKKNDLSFQYNLTFEDKDNNKLTHLINMMSNILRIRQYEIVQKVKLDPNALNIVT